MNENKFAFITCVNNKNQYEESVHYINNLTIPEGYEIDIISVEETNNIFEGYNEAMNSTDAKYKIYINENILIVNKNFLLDILYIFKRNEEVGMIGIMGSEEIMPSGEFTNCYGKIYEAYDEGIFKKESLNVNSRYKEVKVINESIIITQYDLPWRKDIFSGDDLYGAVQSIEFILKGYRVVVPNQYDPWCVHINENSEENNKSLNRDLFIKEYGKRIFPLVSILIPTYNRPEYFKEALESAINQTYPNIEIIIGDDSTNNLTEQLIESYLQKYDFIKYIKNDKNIGQFENDKKLLSLAKGEYINYLMDDDLFSENKIEKMMELFLQDKNKELSLVSSNRNLINENGKIIRKFINKDKEKNFCNIKIEGKELIEYVLCLNDNIIGEPTTVLFRKSKLNSDFGTYRGRKFICNVDQGTWFSLLENGKGIILNEPLSSFRIHDNQQLDQLNVIFGSLEDYGFMALNARKFNLFSNNKDYYYLLRKCYKYGKWVEEKYGQNNVTKEINEKLLLELEKIKRTFPLVSILIPTYNRPDYFKEALESAINQTYPNIEIIICDDSTDNLTEELIKDYLVKYNFIKYIKNESNLGQFENDIKLLSLAKGKYVNFLMDDDLFREDKIEKMMDIFINDHKDEIGLVSSNRMQIDSIGNNIENYITKSNMDYLKNKVWDGKELIELIINNNDNFLGEPTTVLFNKEKMTEKFGYFGGRRYICNVDQGTWFNILVNGKGVILEESLSSFRIHENQQLQSAEMVIGGIKDYLYSVFNGQENGIFTNNFDYYKVVKQCNKFMSIMESNFILPNDFTKECRFDIEKQLEKAKNKLPLVSILIPTYNRPKYFKQALESAINQTYPNIEIIIGDDSTNTETKELIKPYLEKYKNVTYYFNDVINNYHGPKGEAGDRNVENLFRLSKGEYINVLMDDDLFVEDKIEKMINCYLENPNVSLVTSYRRLINENNEFIEDLGTTAPIVETNSILNGKDIGKLLLKSYNFIGEPTTVLVKRSTVDREYGTYLGKKYNAILDMAQWLECCLKGDIYYFREPLSYFRIHNGQNQGKPEVITRCLLEKYDYIIDSYKKGVFINYDETCKILTQWINETTNFINKNTNVDQKDVDKLRRVIYEIEDVINAKKCNICNSYVDGFLPYKEGKEQENLLKYNMIGSDINNFSCPKCYSTDRTRHLFMYLNKLGLINELKGKQILHIAPEIHLYQIISNLEPERYVCGDLFPENAQVPSEKVDITNIQYNDETFDIIICNHVLEHVPDDKKAMSEFYRVLKKGGFAILQTPYSPVIEKSYEDFSLNTDELRLKHFGQEDHVRIFGLDLFNKISEVGFNLDIKKNDDLFSSEECRKFGVNPREDLILVRK
ncbi:MAG: glycosyltransferase [Clostridiales bacterium]|nr:glycosyltransferase [Clostridiales bacterium]